MSDLPKDNRCRHCGEWFHNAHCCPVLNRRAQPEPAAPAESICSECKGSGEGGSYHVPGTMADFVDGPCRSCNGTGAAPSVAPEPPMQELWRLIAEAIGYGSMCWEPRPSTQVFDSTLATKGVEEYAAKVLNMFAAHPPRAPLTDERDQAFEAVRKQLNSLPRYSFQLNSGGGVSRVPDRYGAWIEWQAAHELFDPVAVDAAIEKETPPRTPLLDHEIVTMYAESPSSDAEMIEFARAIERAHGISAEGEKP